MSISKITLPSGENWQFAKDIIAALHREGYRALLVGGGVRDMLMGVEPKDYDIAADAEPRQLLKIFPQADKTGYRFGVLRIIEGELEVQLASFREDSPESNGRRPAGIVFSDFNGDSRRRDFTINAIYYDPVRDEIADPQNGRSDIEKRIIRFIGDPVKRIEEDHLRIMRAIRFSSRFDFRLETSAFEAIVSRSFLVEKISPDRLRDELTKSFIEGNPLSSLDLLHNTKILPILWDIFFTERDLFPEILISFKNLNSCDPVNVWSAFFKPWRSLPDWKNKVETGMRRLNFTRKMKKSVYSELNAS